MAWDGGMEGEGEGEGMTRTKGKKCKKVDYLLEFQTAMKALQEAEKAARREERDLHGEDEDESFDGNERGERSLVSHNESGSIDQRGGDERGGDDKRGGAGARGLAGTTNSLEKKTGKDPSGPRTGFDLEGSAADDDESHRGGSTEGQVISQRLAAILQGEELIQDVTRVFCFDSCS